MKPSPTSRLVAWEFGMLDWQRGYAGPSVGWELGYTEPGVSTFGHEGTNVGFQAEDLDAINVFFSNSEAVTPKAIALKDAWITWFNQLSLWERSFDGNTYDIARNKRNEYNLANARTAEEKAQVETVIKTGMSTEQMFGKADRRLASGMLPEYMQLLSTPTKVVIGLVGAVAVIAAAYATPQAIGSLVTQHTPKPEDKLP